MNDTETIRTDSGVLTLSRIARHILVAQVEGRLEAGLDEPIMRWANAIINAGHQLDLFFDWAAMTSYDSGAASR